MVRAVRFLKKLDQLEERDRTGVFRTFLKVFRSLFLMMLSAHFLGCMFYLLIDTSSDVNWLRFYDEDLADEGLDFEKYITSVYWAVMTVTTVGFGDVRCPLPCQFFPLAIDDPMLLIISICRNGASK